MSEHISREIALRIALAARELPDIEPLQILHALDELIGLPPTIDALSKLTIKQLRSAEAADFSAVDKDMLKASLACLKGEQGIDEEQLPHIEAYQEGDMPGSIRVACASNKGEELDGHFGSCARFLVYQVDAGEARLVDIRTAGDIPPGEDKNAVRAGVINDCQVLFVASIGGPAAAKVVKTGVHPIKHQTGGNTRERIAELQGVLSSAPPPWLAKAMGQGEEERARFERTAEA